MNAGPMDAVIPGLAGFPGATGVTRLWVYDWPTADGLAGGSPHLHTASAEGYVVLGGRGAVQFVVAGADNAGVSAVAEIFGRPRDVPLSIARVNESP